MAIHQKPRLGILFAGVLLYRLRLADSCRHEGLVDLVVHLPATLDEIVDDVQMFVVADKLDADLELMQVLDLGRVLSLVQSLLQPVAA